MCSSSQPRPPVAAALSCRGSGLTLAVMRPAASGSPKPEDVDSSFAEASRRERQRKARLALLEYLLEGQPPITEEERAAVDHEWEG